MPEAVEVKGRFVSRDGEGLPGRVRFIPSKVWVDEDDVSYPTLAPDVQLEDGNFKVWVTRTDQQEITWHYTVLTPIGQFTIHCEGEGPLQMKSLIPGHHKA